ncbi:hypothetical protein GE21DRAFT_1136024 [Neurospora crassa]|nr:hypothetical protein GE21DRAFT_1136024 [Neurospora crassa]
MVKIAAEPFPKRHNLAIFRPDFRHPWRSMGGAVREDDVRASTGVDDLVNARSLEMEPLLVWLSLARYWESTSVLVGICHAFEGLPSNSRYPGLSSLSIRPKLFEGGSAVVSSESLVNFSSMIIPWMTCSLFNVMVI